MLAAADPDLLPGKERHGQRRRPHVRLGQVGAEPEVHGAQFVLQFPVPADRKHVKMIVRKHDCRSNGAQQLRLGQIEICVPCVEQLNPVCQDIHIAVMVQHGCLCVHAIGGGTPPRCGNAGVNGIAHSSIQEKAFSRLPINPLVFLGVHRHHLLIKKQNFFEKTHNASILLYTFFRDCPQM